MRPRNVSRPAVDGMADWLRGRLPPKAAYAMVRWKNVAATMAFYQFSRRFPDRAKKMLVGFAKKSLRGVADTDKHFTPSYKPWDQRLCLVPDADLFKAVREGHASVVTDHIERFTEKGLRLRSGQELEADLVVTATGLKLKFLGGLSLTVDGQPVVAREHMIYKGLMCSDVPNLALAIGYTNASWTLKCDLTTEYVCRMLNHMDDKGYARVVPRREADVREEPLLDFSSGYVQRALKDLPPQGSRSPWKLFQNYALDLVLFRHAPMEDGALEFR